MSQGPRKRARLQRSGAFEDAKEVVDVGTWIHRIQKAFESQVKARGGHTRDVVASVCSGLNTHVYGLQEPMNTS